ncbi:Zinc finger BED domain-containing protein 1 [Merluccius polli]|uniref:Zinc finger BED domain-containing protein 1 n=1 Tax=Merluccius polli TaxID=89951 RepID=A0AA47M3G9_MERPO|nr:Zinc finger BED domain-containing protein 1 [Merluccius polli]KAK0135512.1 Zinc finger BED domain-containing protein 1 [Merluccius polli]KAK0139525.1 Zinc finger BED domain-containing protein 1 [Merluccius polli]
MNVESELRESDHFATITDLWLSRTTEPYISLMTSFFPGEHTGDNIAQEMRGALADWDLKEDQQVCVTTDNASNMIKALEVNGWTRLQCFGHRLHLAIENAVKGDNRISRATGVCKKLVCHFSHSWKKRVALEQAQKHLNLPVHGLITECQTRWSRVLMINRILEQQKALHEVLSEDRNTRHLILGHQDPDVLESVSKALGSLLEFTAALSGEDYVSVSHIKPILNLFNTTILAPEEGDTDMTKSLKKKMLYMNSKYEERVTQELLDVASFVDPRYKTQYISVNDIPIIKARLVSEMKTMEHKPKIMHSVECTRVEEVSPPVVGGGPPPTKKAKKSLASFFKISTASATVPIDPTAVIEAELSAYMQSSTIDNEEDPLLWWRTHKVNFPRLSNMARKYLPPALPQRLFSASGNIVSCERSCLKPDMVNKLVFLAKNL